MSQVGSASAYGTYVWGQGNQQHAVSSESNLIAPVNNPATYRGGAKRKSRKLKKGGDLVNLAVPAVLIAANQIYNPKSKKFSKMKKGGSAEPSSAPVSMNDLLQNSLKLTTNASELMHPVETTIPSVVITNKLPTPGPTLKVGELQLVEDIQQPINGAGILTDIATPALLIAANHLYKRKSRKTRKLSKKQRKQRK